MRRKWFFIGPLAIVGIVLFTFIGGEVVRLLWNWLLPPLFGLPLITFWQALGVLVLSRILFGGFGHGGGRRPGPEVRRIMADRVADRFAQRWDRMTAEERERFRERIRERCGFDPATGERTV
jgi:hypothetical protein